MIPAPLDIELYDGDTYLGPEIVLPSFVPFGGPADLTGATVRAEVRERPDSDTAFAFSVDVLSATERRLRLSANPTQVLAMPRKGKWDLQVQSGSFVGSPLAGSFKKLSQITR